jgi:hypothetical protein
MENKKERHWKRKVMPGLPYEPWEEEPEMWENFRRFVGAQGNYYSDTKTQERYKWFRHGFKRGTDCYKGN